MPELPEGEGVMGRPKCPLLREDGKCCVEIGFPPIYHVCVGKRNCHDKYQRILAAGWRPVLTEGGVLNVILQTEQRADIRRPLPQQRAVAIARAIMERQKGEQE